MDSCVVAGRAYPPCLRWCVQYVRLEKVAHLNWWRQEQISRAWDREMMLQEEARSWAHHMYTYTLQREKCEVVDMAREDMRSTQVCCGKGAVTWRAVSYSTSPCGCRLRTH